jgi:hypothetical protein
MQKLVSHHQELGITYRVRCQNPGCHHTFTLRVTPKEVGLLSSHIVCHRCRRPGGLLTRNRRLGDKVFSADLTFKRTGLSEVRREERETFGHSVN